MKLLILSVKMVFLLALTAPCLAAADLSFPPLVTTKGDWTHVMRLQRTASTNETVWSEPTQTEQSRYSFALRKILKQGGDTCLLSRYNTDEGTFEYALHADQCIDMGALLEPPAAVPLSFLTTNKLAAMNVGHYYYMQIGTTHVLCQALDFKASPRQNSTNLFDLSIHYRYLASQPDGSGINKLLAEQADKGADGSSPLRIGPLSLPSKTVQHPISMLSDIFREPTVLKPANYYLVKAGSELYILYAARTETKITGSRNVAVKPLITVIPRPDKPAYTAEGSALLKLFDTTRKKWTDIPLEGEYVETKPGQFVHGGGKASYSFSAKRTVAAGGDFALLLSFGKDNGNPLTLALGTADQCESLGSKIPRRIRPNSWRNAAMCDAINQYIPEMPAPSPSRTKWIWIAVGVLGAVAILLTVVIRQINYCKEDEELLEELE